MDSSGLLQYGKLTKAFLFALEDGVFLSSNCGDEYGNPIFAEIIVPKSQRDEQWQRIKSVRADQRLCDVFKDKGSYARWKAKVKNAPGSEWNDFYKENG
jgi:hypothetical protein